MVGVNIYFCSNKILQDVQNGSRQTFSFSRPLRLVVELIYGDLDKGIVLMNDALGSYNCSMD